MKPFQPPLTGQQDVLARVVLQNIEDETQRELLPRDHLAVGMQVQDPRESRAHRLVPARRRERSGDRTRPALGRCPHHRSSFSAPRTKSRGTDPAGRRRKSLFARRPHFTYRRPRGYLASDGSPRQSPPFLECGAPTSVLGAPPRSDETVILTGTGSCPIMLTANRRTTRTRNRFRTRALRRGRPARHPQVRRGSWPFHASPARVPGRLPAGRGEDRRSTVNTIANLGRVACIIIAWTLLPPPGALASQGSGSLRGGGDA